MQALWRPYTQMKREPSPLEAVRTQGCIIELSDGRQLVDGIASWWTACHGYNHPHIRQAVAAQLERMPHVMFGGLTHDPAERLAQRLTALLPGDLGHVFFTESGSVSVEVALKMAIQGFRNEGRPEKHGVAAFAGGYHGDTFATMALCDPREGMHRHFGRWLPTVTHLPVPRDRNSRDEVERFLSSEAERTAAVVIEPLVQAAGGFAFHDAETLQWLRARCNAHDVLLIFDEIAVGFARLGPMFACEHAGVVPDIVTLSKALTGGTLPLAATVARRSVFERFWSEDPEDALNHGPTFMANPLGCAAANASLDLFETQPRQQAARRIEDGLRQGLQSLGRVRGVVDVRCWGGLGVVELDSARDLTWFRQGFVEAGVWVRPIERWVYLMPPLVISDRELEQLTRAVQDRVRAWSADRRTHTG